MLLYTYKKDKNPIYKLKETGTSSLSKTTYILTYKSPYNSGDKNNDRVYCEIYTNKSLEKSQRLLVFIHGFSTRKTKLDNYHFFIKKMVEKNYTCAFINLPYHLNRAPKSIVSGENLLYYDDIDTLTFFHQSVVDIRRLIDIMQPYNFNHISLCGLSLGSMVSCLSICHDNRIDKAVLLIGGGNWEEVHWKGVLRFMLKGNCADDGNIDRDKCHSYYSHFPNFLKKLKEVDPEEIDTENLGKLDKVTRKMCFLCDPVAFAHKVDPVNILMVNAKFDFYFSKNSTTQLWRALGKPQIRWVNNFHSSKIIRDPKIIKLICSFLGK